jgi:hypothetical protein
LKEFLQEACSEYQAEIEELAILPDQVQRYGERGPAIWPSPAGETAQRPVLSFPPSGISRLKTELADTVNEFFFGGDGRGPALSVINHSIEQQKHV